MKLYSVIVLYKNPTTSKATILKSAAELSSFSFFYRKNAGEFMEATGKIIAERSAAPSRSSVRENEYMIHCYVRHDNLTGICITDEEYQQRVAFTLLNKALQDFADKIPSEQWPRIADTKDCKYERLPEWLAKWQNPSEADALTRVQDEVEETKIVLHSTMQSVLERGEKLDDLIKASESLSDQSKMFYTQARKMNKCCNWA
ncbi:regulated-SNARE-like domain-containing protein [Ditylenchus destructor]|uniref:Regulated-SNARE-like domain-containing protein n=1 Tax=Ditylenchus destructor TaxID=166010 RepID=A0AAD4NKZ3_9BILA|nr:regulated-SNARE-like domain-containing protein [Ditylenchus destructor]